MPVPVIGVEPILPREHDFESCASTNSATPASRHQRYYIVTGYCNTKLRLTDYPPQNYIPQNYPPQNYIPQNYPPQNYGPNLTLV